ncbi:uncharacterized protein LOC128548386 [Mercenaria mercenaria]|uniref:uncharacterized protein LOC128548386 n=1 Tax=Mercenaria mercenaria TaxID=6596 RepID=UPI00234EAD61|nr:uncharacterized protein LOC128548386 [Mercenaria mercenaria]
MDGIRPGLIYISIIAICYYCELSVCHSSGNLSTNHQWQKCIRRSSDIECNYIPNDIPTGTKTVHLRNLNSIHFPDNVLRKGSFTTHNWGQVKQLEFSADDDWLETHETVKVFYSLCLSGLQNLEVLRISISDRIEFTPQTLAGLNNLKLLDLSGCRRFYLDNLVNSLNQSGVVPNLQSLNLSRLNSYREGLTHTDWFFKVIADKQIKELDISSTGINLLNVTALFKNCHYLEYLNISRVKLNSFLYEYLYQLCPNLKYIDASFIIFPSTITADFGPTRVISNTTIAFDLNWAMTNHLRTVEFINLAAFVTKRTSYPSWSGCFSGN